MCPGCDATPLAGGQPMNWNSSAVNWSCLDGCPERPLSPRQGWKPHGTLNQTIPAGFTDNAKTHSPRHALSSSLGAGASAGCLAPQTLWAEDTRSLPRALAVLPKTGAGVCRAATPPSGRTIGSAATLPLGQPNPIPGQFVSACRSTRLFERPATSPFGSTPWLRYRFPLAFGSKPSGGGVRPRLRWPHAPAECPQSGSCPLFAPAETCGQPDVSLPAFKAGLVTLTSLPMPFTEPAAGSDGEESHGASLCTPGVIAQKCQGVALAGGNASSAGGDLAQSITVFGALEGRHRLLDLFSRPQHPARLSVARTELKWACDASGAAELEFDDVLSLNEQVIGGLRRAGPSIGHLNCLGFPSPPWQSGLLRQPPTWPWTLPASIVSMATPGQPSGNPAPDCPNGGGNQHYPGAGMETRQRMDHHSTQECHGKIPLFPIQRCVCASKPWS